MKQNISIKYRLTAFVVFCLLVGFTANAQRIIIDKPVTAGELTLFPDIEDENAYYYLPDKLQLATNANGKPQFSFLRYVENVSSAGNETDIREGIGGGIVHAVIELSVTPEQVAEARNALRIVNSEGKIQGPVMYSSGIMTIISSFTNTAGDLSKQVVGIGKAPLIDGHKAAISMELTKKGAKILWESFKTPTPDMTFSFEMELEGYSAPKKAIIEADFEKVYNHHGFQLGASGSYDNIVFGGEIDLAFDDLRNSGAIKITNMGADEDMEKLIETAYNKLTTMMFDPIGGTGNPIIKDLVKSVSGKKSPMDRATDLYKQNKGSSTKKTSMLWKYPVLNNNSLLAYGGNNSLLGYYPNMLSAKASNDEWVVPDFYTFMKNYISTLSYFTDAERAAIKKKMFAGEAMDFVSLKRKNLAKAKAMGKTIPEWHDYRVFLSQKEFNEIKPKIEKDSIYIYTVNIDKKNKRLGALLKSMKHLRKDDVLNCNAAISVGVEWFVDYLYGYSMGNIKDMDEDLGKSEYSAMNTTPILNDNLLLAFNGTSHFPPGYHFESKLIAPQDNWTPKQIKELSLDYIQLLGLPKEREAWIINAINNYKNISFSNESSFSNRNYPLTFYQGYLLSNSEKIKYKDILEGNTDPDSEYTELIRDRMNSVVMAQEFLNDPQKDYILSEVEPDPSKSWCKTFSILYAIMVKRSGNPIMPSEQGKKWLEEIKRLGDDNNAPELPPLPDLPPTADKPDTDVQNKESEKQDEIKLPPLPDVPPSDKEVKNDDLTKKDNEEVLDMKAKDDRFKKELDRLKSEEDKKKQNSSTAKKGSAAKANTVNANNKKKPDVKKKERKSDFKLAVMASYQMKRVKQKGTFKINLNKYTTDKVVLRFDENIGKINCEECFHQVNLDDPLFKQREIMAMIDGFNFDDFGKYINFVNLRIKKTHQSGDITYDEVRIDRDNFVKAANNFKMLYGWKGDDNRTKWLDYEFQAQWSFFGGNEVVGDWEGANANAINLAPPYLRKTIELEADPEMLKDKNVRSINVKLFYKVGNGEEVQQVTMMPSREQFSSKVDIMLPKGTLDYEYEITWRITGNKTTSSGRQKTSESILFVDEVEI